MNKKTSNIYGDHSDVALLKQALFGRSVTQVRMESNHKSQWDRDDNAEDELLLDDGTVLALAGNVGGCSCGAGDYTLTTLNDMPINGIMDVQVEEGEGEDELGYATTVYRIFVLAQDTRIRLAEFEGDDGSGYYGTGFWFKVVPSQLEAGRSEGA